MAGQKMKYKEGDLIDESTLKELGAKGGPESSSAVMVDKKGQYIVNLEDDEYFFPRKERTNPRDTIRAKGGVFTDNIRYIPSNVNEDNPFKGSTSQGSKRNPGEKRIGDVTNLSKKHWKEFKNK